MYEQNSGYYESSQTNKPRYNLHSNKCFCNYAKK